MLVETVENTEETEIEDLKAQLFKPTLLFAYRNLGGDIDEGKKHGKREVHDNI